MVTKKYLGNGLMLYESEKGTMIWRMKYNYNGKQSSLSLGLGALIDESEAIKRCEECRIMIAQGKNPRDHRSWLKPKADYAKEYLIDAIEKKAQELLNLVEIMKKQS